MRRTIRIVFGKLASVVVLVLGMLFATNWYIEAVVEKQVGVIEYYGFWISITSILACFFLLCYAASTIVNGWVKTFEFIDGSHPVGCLFLLGIAIISITYLLAFFRNEIPHNFTNGLLALIPTVFLAGCFVSAIITIVLTIKERLNRIKEEEIGQNEN